MTRYRFLYGMGDVVAEDDFADHAEALVWAMADDGPEEGGGATGGPRA